MERIDEFHYQLPRRFGGWRPGSQRGLSQGSGQEFAAHRRLFDHPDPRRIDLRASVREGRGDWLVRIHRLRVAIPVHLVADVSASMHFGADRRKLDVVADLAEALGYSAFRSGDSVGLLAFDLRERDDLFVPARHSRGNGGLMARTLRDCRAPLGAVPQGGALAGLRRTTEPLVGRGGLVFLASDFHWPLDGLGELLDQLAPACVVPVVAWDPAETEPPPARALVALSDAETGVRRSLWMRESLRTRWRDAVAMRRAELDALFGSHGMPPFHLHGRFDAEALTRYFMENAA
ncbi:hypothetical protein H6CHR_03552 [Variovorax sp. PBL-H6]|uniref:DUF58 domain-containing protein n=1 Tax=Variovorax sp. PBL-H6 TaxID=434009 RepID=UPI0013197D48|nr:DUF58 domain-containing protein [Variovorax sp. PBL-H6]VTU31205.1 hypothetical protein H6CHR_03552 [Variovorax sp. PBL-H6]